MEAPLNPQSWGRSLCNDLRVMPRQDKESKKPESSRTSVRSKARQRAWRFWLLQAVAYPCLLTVVRQPLCSCGNRQKHCTFGAEEKDSTGS